MVFIAYNHNSQPISIVNAKSKEIAQAYWQGADSEVHSIKSLDKDFMSLDNHPTGIYPILKTRKTKGRNIADDYEAVLVTT